MIKYELYQTWNGFKIRKDDGSKFGLYLQSVYKGNYIWTTDYFYGRAFSEKTAKKHIKVLKGDN